MSTLSHAALSLADFLRSEQLTFSGTISPIRQQALDLINSNESKRVVSVFNINTTKFIQRLKELVHNPYTINQGNYGLCIPATFLYVIIKDYPVEFVAFSFDLLAKGKANLGALAITTSKDFKAIDFPMVIMLERGANVTISHEADYFLLGAIRDSTNSFYNIEFNEKDPSSSDGGVADTISSYIKFLLADKDNVYAGKNKDLIFWFKETKLYKPTSFKAPAANDPDLALDVACKANETIILSVDTTGDSLEFIPPNQATAKYGHSCVLFSPSLTFTSDKKSIMFHLVTWGKIIGVMCTKDAFKNTFWGYLAVNKI